MKKTKLESFACSLVLLATLLMPVRATADSCDWIYATATEVGNLGYTFEVYGETWIDCHAWAADICSGYDVLNSFDSDGVLCSAECCNLDTYPGQQTPIPWQ